MKISDWAEAERPREKMMAKGPSALSDAELLAILLRVGTQGKSAVDMARDVLARCDQSLVQLGHTLLNGEGQKLSGLGPSKVCTIQAALELGRRRAAEEQRRQADAVLIRSSRDVFAIFNHQLSDLDHEELWALYLSRSGKILHRQLISQGGVDFAGADIRKIARPAIEYSASNVALCHNHPHSTTEPSKADRELTSRARQALALFGVTLWDHLIIADGQYTSMADRAML